MANWCGTARTNYVRVKDVDALKELLEPFEVEVYTHPTMPRYVMLTPSSMSDYGGFNFNNQDEDGNEVEFDWPDIAAHLDEGQILVAVEAGAEKLRYVSGFAVAVAWDGRVTDVNLNDIYEKARVDFNLPGHPIAAATYQDTVA